MPLGWLSFANAYLVLTIVNVLMLIVALILLNRSLQLSAKQSTWLVLTAFCNFGVHSTILQGQTSLIVLVLVALFVCSLRNDNEASAGVWSGALFLKPQFLPIPLLLLALRRHWRGISVSLWVIVALGIISGIVVGQKGIIDYIHIVNRFTTKQSDLGTNPQDMHNLRALALFIFPALGSQYLWLFLSGLVILGTIFLNPGSCGGGKLSTVKWVGNLLALLLVSPHLHAHDLAILIVINALVLRHCDRSMQPAVPLALIALGLWALFPLMFRNRMPPLLPILFVVGFFWCVWIVRRQRPSIE